VEPIVDPVRLTTCGQHYERAGLVRWVNENGSCPFTRKKVGLSDIIEAEAEFAARLRDWHAHIAKATQVAEDTLLTTGITITGPGKKKRCTMEGSCYHLLHRRCTFLHTPEELACAKAGRTVDGRWACPACPFLNSASNSLCGGPEPRRFGCGKAAPVPATAVVGVAAEVAGEDQADAEAPTSIADMVGVLVKEKREVLGAVFRKQFEDRFGTPFPAGKLRDLLMPFTRTDASAGGAVCAIEFRSSPAAGAAPFLVVVAAKAVTKFKVLCKFGLRCHKVAAGTCTFLHPPAL
jgi:hypothetical protein